MQNKGSGISLLVPFRDDHKQGRLINWTWLKKFWEHELPDAELIVGTDEGTPFSKTCALDKAFQQATGDIIVLLDADCFIEPSVILEAAENIRQARKEGKPLWYIPYRLFYRLNQEGTQRLISSDPTNAIRFDVPPNPDLVGNTENSDKGHYYGALIQIMPREAFELTGGMDPRFRGWGGEDITFVRILDTLYGRYHTLPHAVLTLWHYANGDALLRKWEGQETTNNSISVRYRQTYRDKARMRAIIQQWLDDEQYKEYRIS